MRRGARLDLVVVGGGSGGLVSALIAAGAGARVALVERARTGGDCLWTGCVPSKALLAAGGLAHRMRHADRVGLTASEPSIDFEAVMSHVHAARATIAPHDSPERLRAEGVEVIEGEARLVGPGVLVAGGRERRFRAAILATGSEPVIPPVAGLAEAEPLTNETVWDLVERPARLMVLGGGPVGCELSQAFARLGSQVTLVEMAPRLLSREEERAGELVERALRADGVAVWCGTRLEAVRAGDEGHRTTVERDGRSERVEVDRILVAAGRRPSSRGLGLEEAGVETDERGAIVVDERLRTSARGVYAVGDVTGALPFTHVAAYQARAAAVNALFGARRTVSYEAVPWATFTDPEIGRVGLTEAQARERWGPRAVTADFDYETLDRAVAAGEAYGFAKLIADPRGRLVGATVAAPGGGEAIAAVAPWVARGARIEELSRQVHAYPTLAEGPARAADGHLRRRLDTPRTRVAARLALGALRILDGVAARRP